MRTSNGTQVDIGFGALPFEAAMIQHAVPVEFRPGITLPCCRAEDLFILKAFAGRPRDWDDVEGIAARQSGLDKAYILVQLAELCELMESPENVERARRILRQA